MFHLIRSLKVIGTDTDRSATFDFQLVIHSSNQGHISYTVPRQTAISIENRKFLPYPFI